MAPPCGVPRGNTEHAASQEAGAWGASQAHPQHCLLPLCRLSEGTSPSPAAHCPCSALTGLCLPLPDTRPTAAVLHSKNATEAGPGSDHTCCFVLTQAGSAMRTQALLCPGNIPSMTLHLQPATTLELSCLFFSFRHEGMRPRTTGQAARTCSRPPSHSGPSSPRQGSSPAASRWDPGSMFSAALSVRWTHLPKAGNQWDLCPVAPNFIRKQIQCVPSTHLRSQAVDRVPGPSHHSDTGWRCAQ